MNRFHTSLVSPSDNNKAFCFSRSTGAITKNNGSQNLAKVSFISKMVAPIRIEKITMDSCIFCALYYAK
ncbi:uncharacterized protein Gasu_08800 [Galdieria sulphuraria]|uniref:Uncharacterized protein n=1 Tax=Galdieria sulphuraria TaxID=130081 RepID=M2XNQ1_GALSU|nr:uncharacterized protein Gasu_08800 [Galdieria sulphuraria]EME31802.1 hypothetical protein Gasu_08800 [Galdieria sulphuraria]|eukprot:XP_005708322.1 hypothetical protein Gasu_08800 [Galdieria sulphuraria]